MLSRPMTGDGVFDPEATKAMGEAFDRAKGQLPSASRHEFLAIRILEAARSGERDIDRLSAAALVEGIRI